MKLSRLRTQWRDSIRTNFSTGFCSFHQLLRVWNGNFSLNQSHQPQSQEEIFYSRTFFTHIDDQFRFELIITTLSVTESSFFRVSEKSNKTSESHRMSFNKSLLIHLPSEAISVCRASPIHIHNLPSIITSLNSFVFVYASSGNLPPLFYTNRGRKQFFYHFSLRAHSAISWKLCEGWNHVEWKEKVSYINLSFGFWALKLTKRRNELRLSSSRWQIEQNIIVLYSMEHLRTKWLPQFTRDLCKGKLITLEAIRLLIPLAKAAVEAWIKKSSSV